MYQLLGDQVIEVEAFAQMLESKGFVVVANLTRATKREDAIALRIAASVAELGIPAPIEDAQQMDDIMRVLERSYKERLQADIPEQLAFSLYAYTYDEVAHAVLLNLVVMDAFTARRKLRDVAKRLFDV